MPQMEIKVCCSIHCAALGGQELLNLLEDDPNIMEQCSVTPVECLEGCQDGKKSPVVEIGGKMYQGITPQVMVDLITKLLDEKRTQSIDQLVKKGANAVSTTKKANSKK